MERPWRRAWVGRRAAAAIALAAALVVPTGCAPKWVTLRSVPSNPLGDQLQLAASGGPRPSARTEQLLRVYNLAAEWESDPRKVIEKVQAVLDHEPSADKVYALSELAYLEGKRVQAIQPDDARQLYGEAVLHAYHYLFDPRFAAMRNPYDPQFRGACDVYNSALEAALRIESKNKRLLPGQSATIQTASGLWDITCTLRGGPWRAEEFDHYDFVSNYEIRGLKNQYQTYGLGVPLIAVRRSYQGEPVAAGYYPNKLSFPVTAFLRPVGLNEQPAGQTAGRHRAVLELYDPLSSNDIVLGNVRVPLQSDLTTPLAYFLSDFQASEWATEGLIHPETLMAVRDPKYKRPIMGLYMIQPYEAGKIPVLMVHGLWSSPMTWMEMFNDLRAQPGLRDRYQFWFYLYPTSQPFWISAAQLRADLNQARQLLDPDRREPALDQMVLIGHSMGGLVSRLQTTNSGNDYWNLVTSEPLVQVKANDDVREKLRSCFYFQPSPSVRRVITIATPFHGSNFSNPWTQPVLDKVVHPLKVIAASDEQLFRDNPSTFSNASLLKIDNSVDSLAPGMPIFPVMLAGRRPPWVRYHNIVGLVPAHGVFGTLAAGGDGVVSLESARIEGVESEIVVPAYHTTIHTHPLAVLEVRRILQQHLAELELMPGQPSPMAETARLP